MSSSLSKFLYCLILITSFRVHAIDLYFNENFLPEKILKLNAPSKYAYTFVMNHCKGSWAQAAMTLYSHSTLSFFKAAYKIEESEEFQERNFERQGKSVILDVLLKSDGYYIALDDCFKNEIQKKNLFTLNLIMSDALGAAEAGLVTTLAGTKLYQLNKRISSKFAATRAWSSLSVKTQKIIKMGFWTSMLAPPLYAVLNDIHIKMQEHQKYVSEQNHKKSELLKKINELNQDIIQLDKLLLKISNKEEIESINNLKNLALSLRSTYSSKLIQIEKNLKK